MRAAFAGPVLVLVIGVTLTSAVDLYQAKCTITEGNGIKVDSCDATKFLSCQSGRCMCNDLGNQLYDYRLEPQKGRSKRGVKKKIAAGIAGGAIGYAVGKAASKGASGSSKAKHQENLVKVYSCYGRVGSPCVLDYNNVNVVTVTTTTTPTTTSTTESITTASSVNATELANATSTTSTPAPVIYDINKIPKCVRNAICVRPNPSSFSGTGNVVRIEGDPRIGVCACVQGYKASDSDRCEKSATSSIVSSAFLYLPIVCLTVIRSLRNSV